MSDTTKNELLRVGAVQFAPEHKNIQANLEKIGSVIESADADLLVFPELSLSGYAFSSAEEARPFAVAIDSPEMSRIQDIAQKSKIALVLGFMETAEGKLYNSSIAINSDGSIAGLYRKVHLFYYEKKVFSGGDLGFPVYDLKTQRGVLFKLGMQICYDWRFPEASRSLALAGAELIAIPSNIVTTTGMLKSTLQVRAFENKVIIVFADRVGAEVLQAESGNQELIFRGESAIIDYNGEVLTILSTIEESIFYADINPSKTRSKNISDLNNILSDRRKDQYSV